MDPITQLEGTVAALVQRVSQLVDENTGLRAQLALSVDPQRVNALLGQAQALLTSIQPAA